jgi:hypothetical protein
VIADAKDADMAFGVAAAGPVTDATLAAAGPRLPSPACRTSDGIKSAEACLAESDRAGYHPTPPVHHVY